MIKYQFLYKKIYFFRYTCRIINQYLTKLAQDKYYTYELTDTWAVSDRISPRQDLNVWIDSPEQYMTE